MQILSGCKGLVQELAFSHCGRWLAAGGYIGGLHVWDTSNPTKKPHRPESDNGHGAHALAFRPDGLLFFRDWHRHWLLYDPARGALTDLNGSDASYIAVAPNGDRAAQLHDGATLRVWAIPGSGSVGRAKSINCACGFVSCVAFARDDTRFVTAELHRDPKGATDDWRTVELRSAKNGRTLRTYPCPLAPEQLAFVGNDYLVGRWNATLACWDLAEPEKAPRKRASPDRKHFGAMAVHPSGYVLTTDNGRIVRVWSAPDLVPQRALAWKGGQWNAVAVSPDGTRAAVGSGTGKVLVWDWD